MAAIAGIAGNPAADLARSCSESLDRLTTYGSHRELVDLDWACLGALSGSSTRSVHRHAGLTVALDGRIDNRDELSPGLPGLSATASDAELILRLWRRAGPQSVSKLAGSFAFAVCDDEHRAVYLVRDIVGSRPLCFAEVGGGIAFASMPSGLHRLVDARPDIGFLAARLLGLPQPGSGTPWTGVAQVAAGTVMRFAGDGRTTLRHFEPLAVAAEGDRPSRPVEEMRQLLDLSVAAALRGTAGTVATQLSSGLDSSAVTATAAQLLGKGRRLVAFTAAPAPGLPILVDHGWIADESQLASLTARAAGAEHVVIRKVPRILASIRSTAAVFQDVAPNPINLGWSTAINRAAAERGADALLIGFAGNATISFGGLAALRYFIDAGRPVEWARQAIAARRANDISWQGVLFASFEPWLPQPLIDRLRQRRYQIGPFAEGSFVRREAVPVLAGEPNPWASALGRMNADRVGLLTRNDLGCRNMGMEAWSGIEERDPLADRRLVEFCLRLPPEALIDKGRFKPLIRRVLEDRVPREVLAFPQRGFQGADWYGRIDRQEAIAAFEEISASTAAGELLDLPRLRTAIDSWPSYDPGRATLMFAFIRHVTDALNHGLFLAEAERHPLVS